MSIKDPALDRSRSKATLSAETLAAIRELHDIHTIAEFRIVCERNARRNRRNSTSTAARLYG